MSDSGFKALTIPRSRKRKVTRKASKGSTRPKRQKTNVEKTLPILTGISDDDEVSDGSAESAVSGPCYDTLTVSDTEGIKQHYNKQFSGMLQSTLSKVLNAWIKNP